MTALLAGAKHLGLTVSIKKVFKQARPGGHTAGGSMTVAGTALNTVDQFSYLGSMLSSDASFDAEIKLRLSKATSAFSCFVNGLWKDHGIWLSTKNSVYHTVVLSIL